MRLSLIAFLALLALPAPAAAELTPDGSATLWSRCFCAVTLEGRPPQVLVGWSVTVGAGGNGGPVRLRVFHPDAPVREGPWEQLPAEPGTYSFGLNPGIPYDGRDFGLGLDQQVGGRAIVQARESEPDGVHHALDVFRPPIPDDADQVPQQSERREGQELTLQGTIENDLDQDRLGDKTEDFGDLRVVRARITRRALDEMTVAARVLNAGTTVRNAPHILVPEGSAGFGCPSGGEPGWIPCAGAPLAPGAQEDIRMRILRRGGWEPSRIQVAAEGVDTHPGDETAALAPALHLRALRGRRVALTTTQPGGVRLVARVGRSRIVRTVRFAAAGRRVVHLDGHGRIVVIATLRGGRAILRSR